MKKKTKSNSNSNLTTLVLVGLMGVLIFALIFMLAFKGEAKNEKDLNIKSAQETLVEYYSEYCEENGFGIREYNADELTQEMLSERGNELIIEKVIGKCLSKGGTGVRLNDGKLDYISYKGLDVAPGDIVLTYYIYAPEQETETEKETGSESVYRIDTIIDRADLNLE